jgi:hypothetical protein
MKPINVKYKMWIKLKDGSWIMCKDLKYERDNMLKAEQCEHHFDTNLDEALDSEPKHFVNVKIPRENILFYALSKGG